MDGCMDGWVSGWMAGWMDGLVVVCVDGGTERWMMDGWTGRCVDAWIYIDR